MASAQSDWSEWGGGLRTCVLPAAHGVAYRLTVSPPTQPAPLLWVLDGDQHGLTLIETARRLAGREAKTGVAPLAVVAVSAAEPLTGGAHRYRDFTVGPSTHASAPTDRATGGADAFADFLTGPARAAVSPWVHPGPTCLWGHSLGGLFALWLAARRPAGVSAVAAISPSLWWADLDPPPCPVFLAAGAQEIDRPGADRRMIDRARALHARLDDRSRFHLAPDEDHASVVSATAAAALRFLSAAPTNAAG